MGANLGEHALETRFVGRVEVDHRLARRVRVDVGDDDDRVRLARFGQGAVDVLAIDEDGVIIAPVDLQPPQLAESASVFYACKNSAVIVACCSAHCSFASSYKSPAICPRPCSMYATV